MNSKKFISSLAKKLGLASQGWQACEGFGSVWLKKNSENGNVYIIHWSVNSNAGYTRISPGVTSCYLWIFSVESILSKYYKREKQELGLGTVTFRLDNEDALEVEMDNEEDINAICPYIKAQLKSKIFAEFEKLEDLNYVHEYAMELTKSTQLTSFMPSPPQARLIILKALVGADDFHDYFKNVYTIYLGEVGGPYDRIFAPHARYMPDLYEELKPIYEQNKNKR
jgi:hypothetical protein